MSSKKRAAKKAASANVAQSAQNAVLVASPYVMRIIEEEELRNQLRTAVESANRVYGRLSNGKPPAKALMNDKKLQREIRRSADAFLAAGVSLAKPQKKRRRKRGRWGRRLLVLVVLVGVGLAVSETARKKVLDALFGAEEEFDYTSTTTPSTPAPDPVAAA